MAESPITPRSQDFAAWYQDDATHEEALEEVLRILRFLRRAKFGSG